MDKFEDLQAFVAVVEAGTFTAAADRLNTAKSAVSRRVSALEERLGVQLLRRTTRTLNLTDTGQSFYEHSARILADLEEAESAVQLEHVNCVARCVLRYPCHLAFATCANQSLRFRRSIRRYVLTLISMTVASIC
jgi:DNA-binding transcriptional LysR family regulator